MNPIDVVRYGHATLERSLESVPDHRWQAPGCCGIWSVRDVVAHLASYELALADALEWLGSGDPADQLPPVLAAMVNEPSTFNDDQVAQREHLTPTEALEEYRAAHARVTSLLGRLPLELSAASGKLPWYGLEYALDDFIVYANYGHKREHVGQIDAFRDRHQGQ